MLFRSNLMTTLSKLNLSKRNNRCAESLKIKAAEQLGVGAHLKKPYIKEKMGMAVKKRWIYWQ